MTDETKIKLFQNQEVRLKWDDEIEEYYFSVTLLEFLVKVKIQIIIGKY